jgi:hypothetical protein
MGKLHDARTMIVIAKKGRAKYEAPAAPFAAEPTLL